MVPNQYLLRLTHPLIHQAKYEMSMHILCHLSSNMYQTLKTYKLIKMHLSETGIVMKEPFYFVKRVPLRGKAKPIREVSCLMLFSKDEMKGHCELINGAACIFYQKNLSHLKCET